MRPETHVPLTPRMEEAVHELKELITARFPQATFVVEEGYDPKGVYLVTTVDIADTDEVMAVVGDRLVELQVNEGLPVYVTPLRPIKRVIAQLLEREGSRHHHHCRSPKRTLGRPGSFLTRRLIPLSPAASGRPVVSRFFLPAQRPSLTNLCKH